MIRVSDIGKSYGSHELFSGAGFTINPRERIGLLGRNGFGKTTLFRMLLKTEHPDTGEIAFPKNYTVGSLPQQISFTQNTVLDEAVLGLPKSEQDDSWKAKKLLLGLGFLESDFTRNPEEFSGGYQLRLTLARTLLAEPHLLLLDEPTNFLDIVSLRWLERFLNSWKGELMIISHDEAFIDAIAPIKLVIHRRRVRKMRGTTREVWQKIWNEEEVLEKTRVNQGKEKARQEVFIRQFRSGARSAGLVQSRIKMLDKLETTQKLESIARISFSFPFQDIHKNLLLHAHNLHFHYPDQTEDLIRGVSISVYKGDRIGIVGKNGKGKSTLLKLLAGTQGEMPLPDEIVPLSGTIKSAQNLALSYFSQTNREILHPEKTIVEELKSSAMAVTEQEIRSLCGSLLFSGEDAFKPIKVLSGGEKSRVLLGKLFLHPANLLLLDEPTSHLDMESCDALLEALQSYPGAVIIVSHNEKLLRELTNRLVVFEGKAATVYEFGYREFLEEVGWQEEEAVGTRQSISQNTEAKTSYLDRKENAKRLRKVQKGIADSETTLFQLETEQKIRHAELLSACEKGEAENIRDLGVLLKKLQEDIDAEYVRFGALIKQEQELTPLSDL